MAVKYPVKHVLMLKQQFNIPVKTRDDKTYALDVNLSRWVLVVGSYTVWNNIWTYCLIHIAFSKNVDLLV